MICKSVEQFVNYFLNKGVQVWDLSFKNDSMYDELIDFCKKNGYRDSRLYFLIGMIYYSVDNYIDYKEAFKWIMEVAIQGDGVAQNNIGAMYEQGLGVSQDYKEAFKWYKKAAEQGLDMAQNNIGVLYKNGLGVSQDYKEAIKWFEKAAIQGLALAQYNLGVNYHFGEGVNPDYKEAIRLYTKAAEQGLALAQNNIGVMYFNGEGVPQDYKKAFKWYKKAAEQGLDIAQNNIGALYEKGVGVSQDYKEAVKWYIESAEQGNSLAQNNLAILYYYGEAIPQDYKEAIKWFEKAAEQGYDEAQYNLGFIYHSGDGAPQDYKEAIKWYKKAAKQGNSNAQNMLGILHERGQGFAQDYEEAIKWYEKAAKQSNEYGYRNLGNLYLGKKEYNKAKECFEKSIECENSYSLPYYDLGNMYYYGEGVKKDVEKAIEYFSKAKDLGEECDFILNLARIEKRDEEIKSKGKSDNSFIYSSGVRNYALEYANEYKMEKFDYFVERVKESFGANWKKLKNKTQDFLETGIRTYDFYNDTNKSGDYSAIVLELIKALENEIKIYFVDNYFDYLKDNNELDNINNKNILNKERSGFNPDLTDRFTLGDLEKIIGRSEMNSELAMSRDDKSFNDRKRSKNDYNKNVTFDRLLIGYLEERLIDFDKFGYNDEEELINYLIYFSDSVKDISKNFRNPSAHRGDISKEQAEFVINYLLFNEKLFVKFMDKIKE